MKPIVKIIPLIAITVLAGARLWQAQPDTTTKEIIAAERVALDRWGKGDPNGYAELYADDVTYFDPMQARRIDGHKAIEAMLDPIRGKVRVDRYDMLEPKVQRYGDVAILSYRLISYRKGPDGKEAVAAKWNSTQVFRRAGGAWKTAHVHWSFTQPELKNAPKGPA